MTQPPAPRSRLDAHGLNPDDFEWVPIERRHRSDGWSLALQKKFIEALADTGSVSAAADSVAKSRTACYKLRREPGGEGFARAWDAAIAQASKSLVDVAFDRAINGIDEPVANGDNWQIRTRYNDRLLMFLLRAHYPERYAQGRGGPAAARPPEPVAEALVRLEPVMPDDVEDRLSDERLELFLPEPEAPLLPAAPAPPPSTAPPRDPRLVSTLSTSAGPAPKQTGRKRHRSRPA